MYKVQHTPSASDNLVRTRRGESNALRKGQSKIHRRNTPNQDIPVPRGTPARLSRTLKVHNWWLDRDLIALRQQGYVPYSERNNTHFTRKPMRVRARSESREAMTSLALALVAHADFFPSHDYLFEVMVPFEFIAKAMGVLHQYENGRKAYDTALHALSVFEQMKHLVVHRDKDSDTGQNKPVRIWLTPDFFISKGIPHQEIRQSLIDFQNWAIKSGQLENLDKKYQRHLLRMERMGIDIQNKHGLRKLLKNIKRSVVAPDLQEQKEKAINDIKDQIDVLDKQGAENLEAELEKTQQAVSRLRGKKKSTRPYWDLFVQWERTTTTVASYLARTKVKAQHPHITENSEQFYRLLLEQEGVVVT
ncbi:hypothetical protein [Xenorhabdus innexi]|uniref:Sea7 n=1 Tax=Xenorhabdus innexi TaxID=290109 RepID=A0A1N6MWK1_9GAMM|nr:hypothetical protein [Xenorhabdus innexi]PHM35910.1 hypothetical protein Xinn_01980 [Xenorhabdus innexi]SIP73210.1 Sea7 [Xenorhabdus innexi]